MIDCATHGQWCGDWTSYQCRKRGDETQVTYRNGWLYDSDHNWSGNEG